jgi:hypothetical protein
MSTEQAQKMNGGGRNEREERKRGEVSRGGARTGDGGGRIKGVGS